MRHVDYDDRQWKNYERGRGLSSARRRVWTNVLARWLARARASAALDLGSGTGSYSELLADGFDGRVFGVDPSSRMRAVAASEHAHARVTYLEGSGERIPLPDAACDLALLSNVVHHLEDRDACAAELHRVVRPGGVVLVRGILRDSPAPPFLEFFPAAAAIISEQIPSSSEVSGMFAGAFEPVTHELVEQETAASFRDYHERIELRAISTLELISDEEFNEGIERMRQAAELQSSPRPVIEHIDLLVFAR